MKVNYYIKPVVMRVEAVMQMLYTRLTPAIVLVVVNMVFLLRLMTAVHKEEGVQ